MSSTAWLAIFMLLVLKIPLVYLSLVVWWAVRAEPDSSAEAGGDEAPVLVPLTPCGWDDWKRRRGALRPRPPVRPRPLRPGRRPSRRAHARPSD